MDMTSKFIRSQYPSNMSLNVNGEFQVLPGFRFHPTEEELLNYYLKKKVAYEKIYLDVIREIDLNMLEPWDIKGEKCKIGSIPQNEWYCFSHKDKKYPTGTRTNRATAAGFWKATGRDKVIYSSFKSIGMRKTLVFYKGRAPHGQKSDWIMYEYRLDDTIISTTNSMNASNSMGEEDGWVICRFFKKRNNKSFGSPNNSSSNCNIHDSSNNSGALDQVLQYMVRTCKKEYEQLPPLESSESTDQIYYDTHVITDSQASIAQKSQGSTKLDESGVSDWVAIDRFAASYLNAQAETSKQFGFFNDPVLTFSDHDNNDIDLWNFSRSFY